MSDTHIKYNDHSINSAFKNHYIVPDYQREYVWKDEQVEQLLADLLDAYNTDSQKAYFLGTIVTYDSGSQFELIDGQQRLTTFFTLLENTINRSIQNDVYANKATYYKQSKFYITSSISELVNLGQDTAINRTNSLLSSWSDWNKQAIEERQEMFYRLSEMIWELR